MKNNDKEVDMMKGIGISTGMLMLAFFLLSPQALAGEECRNGACRADEELMEVCLLPPPSAANEKGKGNARTSARTIAVTANAAETLIVEGSATPGSCL